MRTLLELFAEIFGGKVLYALVCQDALIVPGVDLILV